MKRFLQISGTLLAIGGTVVFLYFLFASLRLEDLRPHLNARSVIALLLASLLYGSTVPICALAWKRLLSAMDVRSRFRHLNAIMLATQIGKYLPGNVGQHIGRAGLSLKHGLPASAVAASIVYEVLLLLLAGVAVGIAAASLSQPGLAFLLQGRGTSMAIVVLMSIAGLAAIPLVGKLLPKLIARVSSRLDATREAQLQPGHGTIATVTLLYACAYLAIGASATTLAIGLYPGIRPDFALLTAAFAIAWVVGFVTPGAPAGIGVREAMLMLMLGPSMGAADASLLILALRIATTAGDILCFLGGLALMRQLRRAWTPDHDGTHP